MSTNTSTVTTSRASTYLQQLCKHLGHKVPVQFGSDSGQIELPFGTCELRADDTDLRLTVTAENQVDLEKLAKIIASHLERFTFRENPALLWTPRRDPAEPNTIP